MVPITVAYFSAGSASRSRGTRTALLFALGIIATFTALGLALAGIFGAAGLNRFAASPTVNLLFAALFLVFAANLFGWLDLSLPASILNRANRESAGSSHWAHLSWGGRSPSTPWLSPAPS